ncbi:MAG: hypothetical protein KF773_08870 [Deltaproteobacteria bacterium]|nr:hypothetical protein [Deltaproteobacteria bacterium]MCW5806773.1 hypothetical protein [Deltaproteobacteria bacterium]
MAIDYLLGVSCEPQRSLGAERLVALHRTRILARAALARMRDDGEDRPPSEIAVQMTTHRPAGEPSARGVTLQDLLDEAAPLDDLAPHCAGCPAGLGGGEFACHRRIRYPIPEDAEAWLMARLPARLECTAGALLARGLHEFGWDGAPAAKLRGSGTTFFESRAPYGVRWKSEDGVLEVSSDQVFQMMFMVGHLAPTHSMMVALFCGVIPHDISLHDLKDQAGRRRALDAADLPPEPDPAIEQLAAFLRTLAIAARHELQVFIDG